MLELVELKKAVPTNQHQFQQCGTTFHNATA